MTDIISRSNLRKTAKGILLGAALVPKKQVYACSKLPLPAGYGTALLIYTFKEEGRGGNDGGAPEFMVEMTLVIEARGEGSDAETLTDTLDDLADAALNALLTNPNFTRLATSFSAYGMQFDLEGGGAEQFHGSAKIGLTANWQAVFDPVIPNDLVTIQLKGDAIFPADLNGTYPSQTDPAYTPAAPPRTQGPDGRIEIGATIILTTPE
jgi:hypothetical protein